MIEIGGPGCPRMIGKECSRVEAVDNPQTYIPATSPAGNIVLAVIVCPLH